MTEAEIPGYAMGDPSIPAAPITMEEFDRLKQTVMFTEADEEALRMAGDVLDGQIDAVVERLFEFAGSHDFLLYYFTDGHGTPDVEYVGRVQARVGQWIRDTCAPPYDEDWLAYQFEIGRRKHRTKKNRTDDADAVPNVDFRYFAAFLHPITALVRPFLENGDRTPEEVDRMYDAWFKSMVLQVTLRSYPYVRDGDW